MTEKELQESLELFAHKLKNPIHSAVINLDVLKVRLEKLGSDEKIMQHLKISTAEVKRINDIVQKYFGYLKLSDSARKKTDLRKLMG